MTVLTYLVGYVALILFLYMAVSKIRKFLTNPTHLRWELYPVPHEGARAAWGGSYLENTDWWKNERTHSFVGMIKGLAEEMLLLHLTYVHNRDLWYRTYPFHAGLYLCMASFFCSLFGALLGWFGVFEGGLLCFVQVVADICAFVGLVGVIAGASLLLIRRITSESLRKYSTPEHYFNLVVFGLWGIIALVVYLATPSFFIANRDFLMNFFTFQFAAPIEGTIPVINGAYVLLAIYTFALAVLIPATHMGHLFMKYFTWHSIRWDDTPARESDEIREGIAKNLQLKPTWSADHIQGDGKKTWGEIATTNPTVKKDA